MSDSRKRARLVHDDELELLVQLARYLSVSPGW